MKITRLKIYPEGQDCQILFETEKQKKKKKQKYREKRENEISYVPSKIIKIFRPLCGGHPRVTRQRGGDRYRF